MALSSELNFLQLLAAVGGDAHEHFATREGAVADEPFSVWRPVGGLDVGGFENRARIGAIKKTAFVLSLDESKSSGWKQDLLPSDREDEG